MFAQMAPLGRIGKPEEEPSATNWNPRKSNEMTGKSPRRLAVDDLRLHRMQYQFAGREAVTKRAPECSRLLGAATVTDGIVRITLEWNVRKLPRHPHVERIVQEQVRQERRDGSLNAKDNLWAWQEWRLHGRSAGSRLGRQARGWSVE
jgi:hypothetical protein